MTPKEKAKELVDDNICIDYYGVDFYNLNFNYLTEIMGYDPRIQALNNVNFILSSLCNIFIWKKSYWKQVKQEIEKL